MVKLMDGKNNILIVEDEAPLRHLIHKRLSRKGDLVTSFNSAEEALDNINGGNYNVALVDIMLPGMDGIELLKRLKEKNQATEVIIVTGHGNISSAISAMKIGAYDYLTKPCKLSELELVVRNAYEKSILRETNNNLNEQIRKRSNYSDLIGESKKMMDFCQRRKIRHLRVDTRSRHHHGRNGRKQRHHDHDPNER